MITTHILDLSRGKPASGVRVTLTRVENGARAVVGEGNTDADGRLKTLAPAGLPAGTYELTFETGDWYAAQGVQAFHPRVGVMVHLTDSGQHYHVPLLVSPFGYTTYRGS